MTISIIRALNTCALSLFLVSCSGAYDSEPIGQAGTQREEFSDEEREAAQALSVGLNAQVAELDEEPLQRSATCRAALAALRRNFSGTGALSDEQAAAIAVVERQYEQLARQQGAEAGRSSDQVQALLRQETEREINFAEAAPLALRCARAIEEQT